MVSSRSALLAEAVRLASVHSRVIADLRPAIASDIAGFIAAVDQAHDRFSPAATPARRRNLSGTVSTNRSAREA
jgi:hypothetical protein